MVEAKISRADASLEAWAQHAVRLRAARTFVEACDVEAIPTLPVKGIIAAHTLYDDPIQRPMHDVDFRIRRLDHARVAALIHKRGWSLRRTSRVYANHTFVIDGVEVDVEGHVGPPYVCRLTVDAMLTRARRSSVLGFPTYMPHFDDHAVLLVVNAFKDKLERARPWAISDLTRLGAHESFEAERIASNLRAAGLTTIGWLVADWLVETHASMPWAPVRAALSDGRGPALRRLFTLVRRSPDGFLARVGARASADRMLDGVRALLAAGWWELEQRAQIARRT